MLLCHSANRKIWKDLDLSRHGPFRPRIQEAEPPKRNWGLVFSNGAADWKESVSLEWQSTEAVNYHEKDRGSCLGEEMHGLVILPGVNQRLMF